MSRPATYIKIIGRLSLWIQTKSPLSDNEWDLYLNQLTTPKNITTTLVFTDGGAPNATQRKKLSDALQGRTISTAVLSYALIPRFVNASIALFMKSMRSYSPEEFPMAIEYLQITKEEKDLLLPEILKGQEKLGAEQVQTVSRALKAANWS